MVTEKVANPKAEVLKFVEEFDKHLGILSQIFGGLRSLRSTVVQLANDEASLDRRVKAAEARLSEVGRDVERQLSSVSEGSRAIMERISEKERNADKMRSELEVKLSEVNRQLKDLDDARRKVDAELAAVGK